MMSGFRAITESLVLVIVIAGANALFGASDPGWLSLNPTPYLAVPMLVGMRYGFFAGLIGGLVAVVFTVLGAILFGGETVHEVIARAPFTLLALPAVGVVAGEVRRTRSVRVGDLGKHSAVLESELARARAELDLAQEAQGQLQERLVLHGAKFSAADIELRKCFDEDAGPVLDETLSALGALCDVEQAAFYRRDGDGFKLECASGDAAMFAKTLGGADADMAIVALDAGELATPHGLLDAGKPTGDCIAALPWSGGDGLVLMISEMPLEAVTWQNLARVEVFCRWVAETEQAKGNGPVLQSERLRERIELATRTAAEQGVPSTVVLFTVAAGLGGMDQSALQDAVLPQLGSADVAGMIDRSEPHLAVLLPMGGAREAGRLVDSAGDGLNGESFVIRSAEGAEEIWKALNDVA